jgi:hypothetical protein
MRTIRASELGTYRYCQRAWWYQKNGHTPENQIELASGIELHERHGQRVMTAGCLRLTAYALLLTALVMVSVYLAMQLF